MASNYKLDGTDIAVPHSFIIEDHDLREDKRLASGLLVTDFITTKKKFILRYVLLSSAELKTIFDALTASVFVTLTYPDDESGSSTATVTKWYIPRHLWANLGTSRIFRDIQIELIER